jgi:hypothetical protein
MMINRIRSEQGATILIALLFFLLCAVAGSVVLAAGTSAAGKVTSLAAEEQSYYSVTSAARLLKSEIDGKGLYCYTSGNSATVNYYSEPDSDLRSALETAVAAMVTGSDTYEDTLTVKTEDNTANEVMGTVTGKLKIDNKYNIEITLTSSLDDSYTCRVVAPASIQANKDKDVVVTVNADGSKTTRTETKISWSNVKIMSSDQ